MPILQLSFGAVPQEAACVQRPCEAVPAEPCGAHSQPWELGTAVSQQETSTLPEPGGGKTYLQPGTCFIPSWHTSKHQGTTPDVTAADSKGSHNVFHLRTNCCLGRNTVLGCTTGLYGKGWRSLEGRKSKHNKLILQIRLCQKSAVSLELFHPVPWHKNH